MDVGTLLGWKSSLLKGRRMALTPGLAVCAIIACQLRAHSPCGAKTLVSRPNQFTPVRRTSWPAASTRIPPLARIKPWPDVGVGVGAGVGVGTGGGTILSPTIERQASMIQGKIEILATPVPTWRTNVRRLIARGGANTPAESVGADS